MNYPEKKRVNVAVANRQQHDLTRTHITTQDFGRIKPLECRYMVPGDTFNYKVSSFTRLLPMYAPTFGRIDHIQRAFFVPMRTIFPNFYDFLRDRPTQMAGNTFAAGPYRCTMLTLVSAFFDHTTPTYELVQAAGTAPAPGTYDFHIENSGYAGLTSGWYKFTAFGRRLYDFLVSMGLNISFDSDFQAVEVSLLPLLAFWKAYYDWIVPGRFIQDDESNIYRLLNYLKTDTSSGLTSDKDEIELYLLKVPLSFYKEDYFVSAWKKPFESDEEPAYGTILPNPNIGMSGVSDEVNDIYDRSATTSGTKIGETNGAHTTLEGYTAEEIGGYSTRNTIGTINNYTIESLGRLQDYLNRGMLAGSKIQDWLATEFGMRPNSDAIGLSTYLGKAEDVIKIGDVMSTSDTESSGGVPLGSYAGQAKGANVAQFSFSAKGEDHGFFIIISELIPKTSYFQGLKPEFQLIDRLDFFQPEFDNLGVEPITTKELFCSPVKTQAGLFNPDPNKVFGFAPQYAKLKASFDTISGDFRNRFGEVLKPWYLARDVENWLRVNSANGTDFINEDFCKVNSSYQNWDSIFVGDDNTLDHFYSIYLIENRAQRPMLSISEALNPEHPNGSKNVTVNTNGQID